MIKRCMIGFWLSTVVVLAATSDMHAALAAGAHRAAANHPANTVEIGELGQQVRASLTVGDTLRVVLPANPSTGYGWQIAGNNSAVLQTSGSKNTPASQPKPGAPGKQTLTFTASGPGQDHLLLNYSRPWEKHSKPARIYTVEITVVRAAAGNPANPSITPAGTLIGTYVGKLPCADCSGIRTTVAFYATGPMQFTNTYYVRTMTYMGAPSGDVTNVDAAGWSLNRGTSVDPNATVYALQSNGSGSEENYQLRGDTLIALGSDGKPIQAPFDMNLRKQP